MLRNLVKNLAHVSASQATIVVAKGAVLVVLGRVLGPDGYGVYTLQIITPILLSTLMSLGISRAITFYLSGERFSRGTIMGNHLFLVVGMSTVIVLILTVIMFLFRESIFRELSLNNMLLGFLIGVLGTVQILNNGVIHGLQAFQKLPFFAFCQWVSTLLLVGFLWLFDNLSVVTAGLAYAAGLFIYGSMCLGYRGMGQVWHMARPEPAYIKACLVFGSKASVNSLTNVINLRLDYFVVSYFLSSSALGFYAIATSVCEVFLNLFSRGLDIVLLPWVARHSEEVRERTVAAVLRYTLWIMLILAGFIFLIGGPLVSWLFGKGFSPTIVCLKYLLPGLIALSLAYALTGVLMGKNQLNALIVAGILSVTVTLALDLLLIPAIGVRGAAIASSTAYCIQAVFLFIFHYRGSSVPLSGYLFFRKNDFLTLRDVVARVNHL